MSDTYNLDDDYCYACGDCPCQCPTEGPECFTCGDTGRVVAADGCHEYLGYNYLPCPECRLGTYHTSDGPNRPY